MLAQSILGLALSPYRDIDWIALGWRGNDGVTLAIVCPLFIWSLSGPRVRTARWQLVRIGLLGYGLYNYAFYMLGAALNEFFPLYVALFVVAFLALLVEFEGARVTFLAKAFSASTSVRAAAGYLVAVAVCLGLVWLAMWAQHVFAGRPAPGSPEVFRLVAALDLGFMVPALSIGGVLLWRRAALGYVVATAASIQASLYLLVLSVNSMLSVNTGLSQWPGELPVWLPLCFATSVCALSLITKVDRY
jgi:hypothetical protein